MTPMQQQYNQIKEQYPDCIVLFRLGDFFEIFNDDAVQASKILGITLTARGKGENRHPMAGIPHHALPNYLPKLVEAGVKVAIADQTEEAVPGKLVERKVTKIITPGTITDENSLDSSKNNYICSIFFNKDNYYLSFADITTGELKVFETKSSLILKNEINKLNPAEILCSDSQLKDFQKILNKRFQPRSDLEFTTDQSLNILTDQLETKNLKGFGLSNNDFKLIPAAVLISYLKDSQKTELHHFKTIETYNYSDYMQLDFETIRNLELLISSSGNEKVSVFNVLNDARTSMGKRFLRNTLVNPLVSEDLLQERLNSVEYFFNEVILNGEVREILNNVSDLERLSAKIGYGNINPKDLFTLTESLKNSLQVIQKINISSEDLPNRVKFLITNNNFDSLNFVINKIDQSISEEAPVAINEGGIFKEGFNSEIDELRSIRKNAKSILAQMQQTEIENTGISSLKISYNKVFGYYIEVTKSNTNKVPDNYIRKQTLANAERYITDELKQLEDKILSSEEKLVKLEQQFFFELTSELNKFIKDILQLANNIAELDLVTNFAAISRQNQYVKPQIISQNILEIKDGRHLVVEKITKSFTPNDTLFESSSLIQILTGPNMSGKSTYIRQVALITLLAQIGCFVPADSMKFKLVDRIFTRVGASDNLAEGESTFMVEMTETANILNNATENSLIIFDEVGRGTSTYDGVAIAWSIIEFIQQNLKAKTLFATHYHELTELDQKYKEIKNFNVKVADNNGEIVFQHKIIEGSANKSYGVHVAKIAGVPEKVVDRANKILEGFENSDRTKVSAVKDKSNSKNSESIDKSMPLKPKKIHPGQIGMGI